MNEDPYAVESPGRAWLKRWLRMVVIMIFWPVPIIILLYIGKGFYAAYEWVASGF